LQELGLLQIALHEHKTALHGKESLCTNKNRSAQALLSIAQARIALHKE
jgi:hypothetical protein